MGPMAERVGAQGRLMKRLALQREQWLAASAQNLTHTVNMLTGAYLSLIDCLHSCCKSFALVCMAGRARLLQVTVLIIVIC